MVSDIQGSRPYRVASWEDVDVHREAEACFPWREGVAAGGAAQAGFRGRGEGLHFSHLSLYLGNLISFNFLISCFPSSQASSFRSTSILFCNRNTFLLLETQIPANSYIAGQQQSPKMAEGMSSQHPHICPTKPCRTETHSRKHDDDAGLRMVCARRSQALEETPRPDSTDESYRYRQHLDPTWMQSFLAFRQRIRHLRSI